MNMRKIVVYFLVILQYFAASNMFLSSKLLLSVVSKGKNEIVRYNATRSCPFVESDVGVVLLNLGGPETLEDVEGFLYNLFADPDIIRLPKYLSFLQNTLAYTISRTRSRKAKHAYESIGGGSPILRYTTEQARLLQNEMQKKGQKANVYIAMRYWKPFTEEALKQINEDKIKKLVILPLYPQYSVSTTGSSLSLLQKLLNNQPQIYNPNNMTMTVIPSWYRRKGYIKTMAELIIKEIKMYSDEESNDGIHVLFSAHGVPQSYIESGDIYQQHIEECISLISDEIISQLKYSNVYSQINKIFQPKKPIYDNIYFHLSYQSKVGPVQWLKPYTDDTIKELGERYKVKNLVVVPISFVSEHIETLEEIDMEYKELALKSGIQKWRRAEALNTNPKFIEDAANMVIESLNSPIISIKEAMDMNKLEKINKSKLCMFLCFCNLVLLFMMLSTKTKHLIGAYNPIPADFILNHVTIMHRHGDRAQISKETSPKYPESVEFEQKWVDAMPTPETFRGLPKNNEVNHWSIFKHKRYSNGWDVTNSPYAQLTDVGSKQLIAVGKLMRERYCDNILKNVIETPLDSMYCRSSNICRTMQSLHSLLFGLFDEDLATVVSKNAYPHIHRRHRSEETMYPQADGHCKAIEMRKQQIFSYELMKQKIHNYEEFETRMNQIFGFEKYPDWMKLTDVLSSQFTHNFPSLPPISLDDLMKIRHIAGWMWSVWYNDDELNRYGIGRFLYEVMQDIDMSLIHGQYPNTVKYYIDESEEIEYSHEDIAKNRRKLVQNNKEQQENGAVNGETVAHGVNDSNNNNDHNTQVKMSIYSGHDSTIVPVLCALGIYDGVWPPYASHLTLEIVTSKSSGKKFIRTIYNNEDMYILGYNDSVWCPYELFENRMKSLSITHSEYQEKKTSHVLNTDNKDNSYNN